ncbi:hypothetical protein Q8A67_003760 [Cirrhinus molitorella]|uniref:Uncharacterized protein n=1 Tax=Cirrhinus molitorella TaxID=172907 RepID=A0AA88TY68_9TELE|nr:hypothetical protein Q8A67_003760 [Cirrhinus molitorella]
MSADFQKGATTVAPMADSCSPQETTMPRLFTLGWSEPASSMRKRQVQKGRSQACLFQKRWGFKPRASLKQRELNSAKPPQTAPVLECYPQEAPKSECSPQVAPVLQEDPVIECSPQRAPVPRLFTLGLSIPAFSTRNFRVRKERSCMFQERRGYKPQASLRQREPKPVKLPQRSPVAEDFPQECSSEEAPMPKLFTLGMSIPALSTKKYRQHKLQASLTHRTRLSVITAEKSSVAKNVSIDEARVEAMEPKSSSSNKATKAQKEAPMPERSLEEEPILECSPKGAPVPRLFTLGLSIPTYSTKNFHVRKGRSCLFQKHRGYKPQASLIQREPEPVELPQRSPVPEGFPQECSSEEAPMLQCFFQGKPAETKQEEPVFVKFPDGEPLPKCSPHVASMPKLFTLGMSIPVLSTKQYRLHKHQASLTHRTRLPLITAELWVNLSRVLKEGGTKGRK